MFVSTTISVGVASWCICYSSHGYGRGLKKCSPMECLKPYYVAKNDMVVPCGRCPFCAATKRSDWSTRLQYEDRLHLDKKFVTLTYSNNNLSWYKSTPQLVKSDLQKWFKRVRKAGFVIRYFAVGEYGAHTYRPHYHVLLFGSVPEDVIRETWGLGHVNIGRVTQASINYCLGYIVNGKAWQMKRNRVPPFSLVSRGNGIEGDPFQYGLGANYLSPEMIAWHKSGRKNFVVIDGVRRHLPRYYKTKIFSKIDLVRIAVRDQKDLFKRQVEWIRHPKRMKMKNPLAYRDEQMRRAAMRIIATSKENLTI